MRGESFPPVWGVRRLGRSAAAGLVLFCARAPPPPPVDGCWMSDWDVGVKFSDALTSYSRGRWGQPTRDPRWPGTPGPGSTCAAGKPGPSDRAGRQDL